MLQQRSQNRLGTLSAAELIARDCSTKQRRRLCQLPAAHLNSVWAIVLVAVPALQQQLCPQNTTLAAELLAVAFPQSGNGLSRTVSCWRVVWGGLPARAGGFLRQRQNGCSWGNARTAAAALSQGQHQR